MAKSRRKDPSNYVDSTILLNILGHLSKIPYFDLTVHKQEDYSLLEDYFEVELQANTEHLQRYSRILECTLLLDNTEYQSLVYQLCNNEKIARNTRQYIHSFDINSGELCIINLYRDLRRQLKSGGKKIGTSTSTKQASTVAKGTKTEAVTPEKVSRQVDRDLGKLEKQLKRAIHNEDYHLAAKLKKEIDEIKEG